MRYKGGGTNPAGKPPAATPHTAQPKVSAAVRGGGGGGGGGGMQHRWLNRLRRSFLEPGPQLRQSNPAENMPHTVPVLGQQHPDRRKFFGLSSNNFIFIFVNILTSFILAAPLNCSQNYLNLA